jgi:hypothetical protein
VREWLAKGLVNSLTFTKHENDLQPHHDLLMELRELQQTWPQDPVVRNILV